MAAPFTIEIERLGHQGDGIGQIGDTAVFVPYALPGETVRAESLKIGKHGINARLVEILEKSPERQRAPCEHFTRCGGCVAQHFDAQTYAEWRRERVASALLPFGINSDLVQEPIILRAATRRRAAFSVRNTEKGPVLGFLAAQSHRIILINACSVSRPEINHMLAPIREMFRAVLAPAEQAKIQLTVCDNGLDIVIDAGRSLSLDDRYLVSEFCEQYDIAACHWRSNDFLDPVSIRREPLVNIDGVMVPFPPGGFLQASEEGQACLIDLVTKAADGASKVADLFCGLGTFALPLAKNSRVLAAESDHAAMHALKAARASHAELKQIITRERDLFRSPIPASDLQQFDCVVFDPPRAGAKAQVEEIAASGVRKVIAVSCNPNSFARDAACLVKAGYKIMKIIPVDQFLWSQHIEIFAIFES